MSRAHGERRSAARRQPWRPKHRAVGASLAGAAGAAGALGGGLIAGRATGSLGPLTVTARFEAAVRGGVRIDVPPLGHADLAISRPPVRLRLVATDVEPDRFRGLLRVPETPADGEAVRGQLRDVVSAARRDATRLARRVGVRAASGALVGIACAGALTRAPRASAVGGAGALGALAAIGGTTVDREAWRSPDLAGLLAHAPRVLGDLRTAPERLNTYRDQLADLVRTGTGVYRAVADLPEPPPADAVRLLHISDVHLSPFSYGLVAALVEQYRVDAVIDTGDLVDWGTSAETAFAGQIDALGVPYLYVKGNHDSGAIAEAVAAQRNATVLDLSDPPVQVAGLSFAGMADPRFTPDKTTGDDHAAHRVSERAGEFADRLSGAHVDVLLVHDPSAARQLAGIAPLILCGHTHIRAARRVGTSVVLVQGTSGGSGLRGVQQEPPTPISMSVLYLDRTTRHLWGADEVTVGGIGAVTVAIVRRPLADLLAGGGGS